jgi:hypothetical protein
MIGRGKWAIGVDTPFPLLLILDTKSLEDQADDAFQSIVFGIFWAFAAFIFVCLFGWVFYI